ncbi:hypothetical protein DENSPDRAFT_886419 [Dentipellis sp. KUC8613]|nr:hypothetical protein DENSPDRAFT_886419 [Dentipellis sp. KUC8613]
MAESEPSLPLHAPRATLVCALEPRPRLLPQASVDRALAPRVHALFALALLALSSRPSHPPHALCCLCTPSARPPPPLHALLRLHTLFAATVCHPRHVHAVRCLCTPSARPPHALCMPSLAMYTPYAPHLTPRLNPVLAAAAHSPPSSTAHHHLLARHRLAVSARPPLPSLICRRRRSSTAVLACPPPPPRAPAHPTTFSLHATASLSLRARRDCRSSAAAVTRPPPPSLVHRCHHSSAATVAFPRPSSPVHHHLLARQRIPPPPSLVHSHCCLCAAAIARPPPSSLAHRRLLPPQRMPPPSSRAHSSVLVPQHDFSAPASRPPCVVRPLRAVCHPLRALCTPHAPSTARCTHYPPSSPRRLPPLRARCMPPPPLCHLHHPLSAVRLLHASSLRRLRCVCTICPCTVSCDLHPPAPHPQTVDSHRAALCCMPTTPSSHLRRPPRVSTRRASAVVPRPRVAVSRPYATVLRLCICDTASRASAILARPRRPPMSTRRRRFVPVRHPFALVRRRFAPACPCRPVLHFRRPCKLPSSLFAPCRTLFASHGVASHPVGHLVPHLAVSVPRTAVLAVCTRRPVVSRPTASSCASPRRLRAPPRRLRAASLALNTPPRRLCAVLRGLGPRSAFFAAPAVGHLAATAPSVRHAAPSFTTLRGLCGPPRCFRVAPRALSCAAIALNLRLTDAVSRPTDVAALAPPRPAVRPHPRAAVLRHRATIVLDAPPSHPHHAPYASRASPRATITPLAAVVAAPAGRRHAPCAAATTRLALPRVTALPSCAARRRVTLPSCTSCCRRAVAPFRAAVTPLRVRQGAVSRPPPSSPAPCRPLANPRCRRSPPFAPTRCVSPPLALSRPHSPSSAPTRLLPPPHAVSHPRTPYLASMLHAAAFHSSGPAGPSATHAAVCTPPHRLWALCVPPHRQRPTMRSLSPCGRLRAALPSSGPSAAPSSGPMGPSCAPRPRLRVPPRPLNGPPRPLCPMPPSACLTPPSARRSAPSSRNEGAIARPTPQRNHASPPRVPAPPSPAPTPPFTPSRRRAPLRRCCAPLHRRHAPLHRFVRCTPLSRPREIITRSGRCVSPRHTYVPHPVHSIPVPPSAAPSRPLAPRGAVSPPS